MPAPGDGVEGTDGEEEGIALGDARGPVLDDADAPNLLDRAKAYTAVLDAPWDPAARNFAWDLIAGVLPCGRGIKGVSVSHCLVCASLPDPPTDSVTHLMRCPCLS